MTDLFDAPKPEPPAGDDVQRIVWATMKALPVIGARVTDQDGHLIELAEHPPLIDTVRTLLPEANVMRQVAPFPEILASLVGRMTYRPGWRLALTDSDRGQGSEGLTLEVVALVQDTHHDEQVRIRHLFPVPPAAFNEQSWRRWLFERLLEVERHEAAEFFRIDGEQPYAPHHGPGNDPYIIFEHGSDEDRRTDFRGRVHDH